MKHLTLAESTYDQIIDGVNDGLTVWHLRKNTLRRLGVTARSAGAAHSPSCRRLRNILLVWDSKPPLEP